MPPKATAGGKAAANSLPKMAPFEILQPVFQWLLGMNIMQPNYAAKKKGGSVLLTQPAALAFQTGHVLYYVAYNVLYNKGLPMTAQIFGSPGETLPRESVEYNWQSLNDVFGTLGLTLPTDTVTRLVAGDAPTHVELLYEFYNGFSGQPAVGTTADTKDGDSKKPGGKQSKDGKPAPTAAPGAGKGDATAETGGSGSGGSSPKQSLKGKEDAKAPPPKGKAGKKPPKNSEAEDALALMRKSSSKRLLQRLDPREGATSVDTGKRMKTAEDYLQEAREKFAAKKAKEEEERAKKEQAAQEALALRQRMNQQLGFGDSERRIDLKEMTASVPTVVREFSNRGVVMFCHNLVLEMLDDVEDGVAKERLERKAQQREKVRLQALERKNNGHRLVDVSCSVHVPRHANHALFLQMKSLVMDHIVNLALSPNVREELANREAARKHELSLIRDLYSHATEKAQPVRPRKIFYVEQKEADER
jgi:hypothetical protein